MAAVQQNLGNSRVLVHASEDMQNNKAIVMAALKTSDGLALKCASKAKKDNETIVLEAIASERKRWPNRSADERIFHCSKHVQARA